MCSPGQSVALHWEQICIVYALMAEISEDAVEVFCQSCAWFHSRLHSKIPPIGLGKDQISYWVFTGIHIGSLPCRLHGKISDPPRVAIRRKVVTWGTDLCFFARGVPSEKNHKSFPRVTIFLLIDMLWWIICLPWHNTLTYTSYLLIFTNPGHSRWKNYTRTSLQHTYLITLTSKRFATLLMPEEDAYDIVVNLTTRWQFAHFWLCFWCVNITFFITFPADWR